MNPEGPQLRRGLNARAHSLHGAGVGDRHRAVLRVGGHDPARRQRPGAHGIFAVVAPRRAVPSWPYGQIVAIVFMLFIFAVLSVFPDTRLALFVVALLTVAYWLWVRPNRPGGPTSAPHP